VIRLISHPRAAILVAAALTLASGIAAQSPSSIEVERRGCRGTCPVYQVTILRDGRVRFTGSRHVALVGLGTRRISRAAVTRLNRAFVARGFGRVPSRIDSETKGCGDYMFDLPTVKLSAQHHAVEFDTGCPKRPAMLDSLADLVDSVAGTRRWIVGDTTTQRTAVPSRRTP
jgi:hypothetical protein